MTKISYGKQSIDKSDIDAAIKTLKSKFLTTGPKVIEFEKSFQNSQVVNTHYHAIVVHLQFLL